MPRFNHITAETIEYDDGGVTKFTLVITVTGLETDAESDAIASALYAPVTQTVSQFFGGPQIEDFTKPQVFH